MKLLITDLDNTLYDWVTFYSQSFEVMALALSKRINVPLDTILSEYKEVHQRFGNTEKPFATLELPSVIKYFNCTDKEYLQKELTSVFGAFSAKRKETLKLYPNVRKTLEILKDNGVKIVGHTEALEFNSLYRIDKLNILEFFDHLYTLEDNNSIHPNPKKVMSIPVKDDFIVKLPLKDSKPNPELLKYICSKEGVRIEDAIYVGDSLTKDISMAKEVGMTAVWANYGRNFSPDCWKILVQITHWTKKDVLREEELKKAFGNVKPDFIINDFSEILTL
ncbi:HAD family hydrolase [Photobacterium phosphoreum]|uniref:HAD family hydrolase n=1 Tax=Photobacterium phosphoreum TaxID=659 RepID=UPI001E607840|nr:HAD-IA family hydrolase [Photobacterium phosphoreum]MCD9507384.1 HAD-IA family hydrolase [Photobacterium phosphoreum]